MKTWIIRGLLLALAAGSLSACIVVPEGGRGPGWHRPYYWR